MLQARARWKRVHAHSHAMIWTGTLALILSLCVSPTPSSAATTIPQPIRGVVALTITSSPSRALPPVRHAALHHRVVAVTAELADFTAHPTPSDGYVVTLIHQDFPQRAWHDAEAVAWCESKFRTTDIGFDSNGTHDRGLFQLNDGGTEEYLMAMIGQNPKNLSLAFNPVLNVRAAALLYARDGWSQWSCARAI
jgi:Transglycosylase SLT domain